jgi:ketosteroid isomerase-like protein
MTTAQQDFDEAVKQYNLAMSYFFKGNPEPINNFYSKNDNVSLAQLSGGLVLGRNQVTDTVTRNAMKYQDGDTTFETLVKYVTPEFAYIIQVERTMAKIGGRKVASSLALRVTSVFLREDGIWKLLHRHVDSNVFPPA